MNPESHLLLIVAAYLFTFIVVLVMLARILADYRGLTGALARIKKKRPGGDGAWN